MQVGPDQRRDLLRLLRVSPTGCVSFCVLVQPVLVTLRLQRTCDVQALGSIAVQVGLRLSGISMIFMLYASVGVFPSSDDIPTHFSRVMDLPTCATDAVRADRVDHAVCRRPQSPGRGTPASPAGFTGRTSADGGGPGFRLPAVMEGGGSNGRTTPTLAPLTGAAAALAQKQRQRRERGWLLQPPVLLLALGACIVVLQVRSAGFPVVATRLRWWLISCATCTRECLHGCALVYRVSFEAV